MSRTRASDAGSSLRFGLSSIGVHRIGRAGIKHEADGHGSRAAVGRDRDQDRPPGRGQERAAAPRTGRGRPGTSCLSSPGGPRPSAPTLAGMSRRRWLVIGGVVLAGVIVVAVAVRGGDRAGSPGPGATASGAIATASPAAVADGLTDRVADARLDTDHASDAPPHAGADGTAACHRRSPARLRRVPPAGQRRSRQGRGPEPDPGRGRPGPGPRWREDGLGGHPRLRRRRARLAA